MNITIMCEFRSYTYIFHCNVIFLFQKKNELINREKVWEASHFVWTSRCEEKRMTLGEGESNIDMDMLK